VRGEVIGADGNLIASDTMMFTSAPRSSAATVSVSVAIDRGPGATYRAGEPIVVCATVSSAGGATAYPVRLTDSVNGNVVGALHLGLFEGRRCFEFSVMPPAGEEVLRVEALDTQTGAVLGSDSVTFFVQE
jgi:hypothetical protein